MVNSLRAVLGRAARSYVVIVALGLVIGLTLAPVAWQAADSDGTVAVVPLAGTIDGNTAAAVGATLERAREDPDVKAVVIVSNSGGGGASASEELYLQTKRTAAQMPVVASIDASAASGAYYTIAPADTIFAKPASIVGSVGVLTNAPTSIEPNDIIATTGPNKLSGGDDREFYYLLESLGEAFYNAVETSRGDALELSRTELSQARIYSGTQAVSNGLADEIGGRQAAVEAAAERAGLDDYEVERLRPRGSSVFLSRNNFIAADVEDKEMIEPEAFVGEDPSGPTFLMLPASYLGEIERADAAGSDELAAAGRSSTAGGTEPVPARAVRPTGHPAGVGGVIA